MDARKRILIVDDEPNVRLVCRTAPEATGYLVTEAADGDAALAQLRDDAEFFLRIADALRPGSQVVSRLRETLQSRKLHPEGFSFRALGELLG